MISIRLGGLVEEKLRSAAETARRSPTSLVEAAVSAHVGELAGAHRRQLLVISGPSAWDELRGCGFTFGSHPAAIRPRSTVLVIGRHYLKECKSAVTPVFQRGPGRVKICTWYLSTAGHLCAYVPRSGDNQYKRRRPEIYRFLQALAIGDVPFLF